MNIGKPLLKERFYYVKVATNNIINSLSTKGPYTGHLYENRVDMVLRGDKVPVIFVNSKQESIFRITPEEYANEYKYNIPSALKAKNIAIDDNGYAVVLTSNLLGTKEEVIAPAITPETKIESNENAQAITGDATPETSSEDANVTSGAGDNGDVKTSTADVKEENKVTQNNNKYQKNNRK